MSLDDSEPATQNVLNHCVKILIFGSIAFGLAYFCLSSDDKNPIWLFLLTLIVSVAPFLAAVSRNFHALLADPHLRLSPAGISLRYWRRISLFTFWRFTYRIIEREIPWSQYIGCRVVTRSSRGIPIGKDLIIEANNETHVIGWDIFRPSVRRIQSVIADFIEMQFSQTAREKGHGRDLCRRRFKSPLLIEPDQVSMSVIIFILGAGVAAGAVIALLVPKFPQTNWTAIPGALVFAATMVLCSRLAGSSSRYLELREGGLALGPDRDASRLIDWDDILFARTITARSRNRSYTVSYTDALEIRLRDGSSMRLGINYKRSLDDLLELIDPPVDKAAIAWALVMKGEDVETAAVAAGLPKR